MSSASAPNLPPLSIALLGVGAIGSAFAYHLARAGNEVTVVARPGSTRLQQLQRDQAVVLKTGEKAEVRIADRLDEQAAYDLVIVTTLAHQLDAVLPSLRRSKAKCIHFMMNVFEPEKLRSEVGESRSTFGMPFVMSSLSEGVVDTTSSPSRKTLHSDQRWVQLFDSAGIPSAYESDMLLWLRCHVPLCIAMESTALQAKQRDAGVSWKEATVLAKGLHAGLSIVKGLGYPLYPSAKKLLDGAPNIAVASMLWSMSRNKPFRELLATGVNECRALVDVVTAAGSAVRSVPPATIKSVLNMKP